jgi:hypothetical protein
MRFSDPASLAIAASVSFLLGMSTKTCLQQLPWSMQGVEGSLSRRPTSTLSTHGYLGPGPHCFGQVAAGVGPIWRCRGGVGEYSGGLPPNANQRRGERKSFSGDALDGGVTAPVLTLPEAFLLRYATLPNGWQTRIYILINNKVERDFQVEPDSTVDIAARASSSATKTQTRSVLYETYDFARRNKFGFNLTYIEKDVPASKSPGFETKYMRALYQYGYERARAADFWAKAPPTDDLSLIASGRDQRSATLR